MAWSFNKCPAGYTGTRLALVQFFLCISIPATFFYLHYIGKFLSNIKFTRV